MRSRSDGSGGSGGSGRSGRSGGSGRCVASTERMRTTTLALTLLLTCAAAAPGWAQPAPPPAPRLIVSEQAIAKGLASAAAPQQLRSDDTLLNGAVIGAVVGGAALGVF